MAPNGGPMMKLASFGGGQQFYPNNHVMHTLLAAQQSSVLKMRETSHTPCPKDNTSSDVNPSGAKDC